MSLGTGAITVDELAATLRRAGIDPDTLATDDSGTLRHASEGGAVIELPSLTRDQLHVLDRLGEGGFGIVERAVQVPLGREVAIKRATVGSGAERLVSEARVTGHLEHPNVVPIHALGVDDDGEVILVMKRIEGRSWSDMLRDPGDPAARVEQNVDVLIEVCRAAHFAHERGVLHRDLKPDNVMVGSFGEIYVLDWGIAVRLDDKAPEHAPMPRGDQICGTPGYMAPEMCDPEAALDRRTDVYLLGAILYRVLTGKRAFSGHGRGVLHRLAMTLVAEHLDPGESAPAELRRICMRATALAPEDRYETADQLRLALERFRSHAGTLRLAATAALRVGQLEALSAVELDDGEATRCYHEALFGFRQAIAEWPEIHDAAAGIARAHLSMARRELARGRAEVAAQILRELDEVPPEVQAELDQAVESRQALQSIAIENDARLGEQHRAALALLIGICGGSSLAALAAADQFGLLKITNLDIAVSNLSLLAIFAVAVVLRPGLRQNRAARQLVLMGGATLVGIVVIAFYAAIEAQDDRHAVAVATAVVTACGTTCMGAIDRRFLLIAVAFGLAIPTTWLIDYPLYANAGATYLGFTALAWSVRRWGPRGLPGSGPRG